MRKNTLNLNSILTYSLLSVLLLSCSSDDASMDDTLENTTIDTLSSKSVEIPVSSISASSQHSSYPPEYAIDDNISTRWAGNGSETNLDIDLGVEQSVDYVKIAYYKGDTRTNDFIYWISNDGKSWTYVQQKTSSGTTDDYETFDLTNESTRYIRIECQGSSVDNWNNISEIKVYGTILNTVPSIPTTTNTNNDNSDTEDVTTVSDTDSNIEIEAETEIEVETVDINLFDLEDFQIETSWDSSGESYKKTASYDAESTNNKDWYNKVGDTYVLRCEAKDGNRTEWKERSGNEASLFINKAMEYTTQITNEPENGVTIAQIHNRGGVKRPYVRVYLEHGEVLIKETTSYPGNDDSKTYETYDENLKYNEGTDLTVKIETKSGNAYITITTTNGSYSKTLTPSENWTEFSNHYYLKAGVYTEGNNIEPISTFSKFSFNRD